MHEKRNKYNKYGMNCLLNKYLLREVRREEKIFIHPTEKRALEGPKVNTEFLIKII